MPSPDWTNSLRQALKSSRELASYLGVELPELDYPVLVPRALAAKIKSRGPDSALWKQFVPHKNESQDQGLDDPIADAAHSPTPMIVHRYKNRVLFLATQRCPVICRYCFRKNELYTQHEAFGQQREQALEYLRNHSEIKEVIFSGGDPLILTNSKIQGYLDDFEAISHLKYLRFHSRAPIVLPERVEQGLLELLTRAKRRYLQVTVVIHCNHLEEIDPQVEKACRKLIKCGVSVLSQSVLMKGVNDNLDELTALFEKLVALGVRPYYLHHPDDARGAQHFKLNLQDGQNFVSHLRDRLPGWALPRYTLEQPGGAGKIDAMNLERF